MLHKIIKFERINKDLFLFSILINEEYDTLFIITNTFN